jgi:sulfite reductase (NADPH) hemoprotein beta-component
MALQVVTANRLGDGRVVYLADGDAWVEEVGRARIAESEETGKTLTAVAEKAVAERLVVGPYLIDVKVEGDRVTPTRYREVLRALGPSTHPEFSRPAAVTAQR